MSSAVDVLLWGAPGPWPFRGAFRGRVPGVSWAGRVGQSAPLDVAFRMARTLDGALTSVTGSDRRRRVAAAWDAVCAADVAGQCDDLTLLIVGHDDDGSSVSGVGLAAVWAGDGRAPMAPWIPVGHPMLTPRGMPSSRPGALSVAMLPPILVACAAGDSIDTLPPDVARLRHGGGVWP